MLWKLKPIYYLKQNKINKLNVLFKNIIRNKSTKNGINIKKNVKENVENKHVNKNEYILSLDEALYLSKEMGIKTKTEMQKIIMRSPPFSPDASPFVIDNFFNTKKNKISEEISNINRKIEELENSNILNDDEDNNEDNENIVNNNDKNIQLKNQNNSYNIINKILLKNFNKNKTKTFFHDGREWLEESEGIGTNKRACAYVYIRKGSGIVKINNQEDIYIRWPYFYNRIDIIEPLYVTNTCCIYDVFIILKGGGISGQSKATRLAISRALLNASPSIYPILIQEDMLYEDLRQKFPKLPGRKKSRAMKQWSKR